MSALIGYQEKQAQLENCCQTNYLIVNLLLFGKF